MERGWVVSKTSQLRWLGILLLMGSTGFIAVDSHGDVVTYRLEVDNTWSEENHPGAFPFEAHFSWFGGATHNDQVSFWQEREPTSAGMTQMAEDGRTIIFMDEVAVAMQAGNSDQQLSYQWWFCPTGTVTNRCGETTVEFAVDSDFPLVTMVSMLGPSPDWFVGVSGLPLRENGQWHQEVVVDLRPYDGGTRSLNRWRLFGDLEDPPLPIALITEESGQLVGPDSLGSFTFTLLTELPRALPGDCNDDGELGLSDGVCTLEILFSGTGSFPCGDGTATDAANQALIDWQPDGVIDVSDVVGVLTYLFLGGPPHPLAVPGSETTGCVVIPGCESGPSGPSGPSCP